MGGRNEQKHSSHLVVQPLLLIAIDLLMNKFFLVPFCFMQTAPSICFFSDLWQPTKDNVGVRLHSTYFSKQGRSCCLENLLWSLNRFDSLSCSLKSMQSSIDQCCSALYKPCQFSKSWWDCLQKTIAWYADTCDSVKEGGERAALHCACARSHPKIR